MKKEYINNEDTAQEPLHLEEPDVAYHAVDESVDTFEEDWENAITGEELVKRVHEHIESINTFEEDWEKGLTPEEFMQEMEERIDKWHAKQ